jgi:hypothetical protein
MAEPVAALQHGPGVFSRRANAAVPTLQGMDKSNIAFALITAILAVYITVALVLSRVSGKRESTSGGRARNKHKKNGPWTSFSS